MRNLQISESAKDYLSQFCAERNQGRSGKLHWDAFLAHVLNGAPALPAADLHSWLQENLEDKDQIETVVDDYQRIERLFDQARKITREGRLAKGPIDALESMTDNVSPTDKSTTDSVERPDDVFPDLMRFASSLWSSISTTTLPGASRTLPDYVPPTYKTNHETILKKLSMPAVAGSIPLGTLIDSRNQVSQEKRALALPPELRAKTMLVLGGSDTGKTRFLAGSIAHDIEADDRAIVVIDTSGDLVKILTRWMSRHANRSLLERRVILLDPSSKNKGLAFNPLDLHGDCDLQSAATVVVNGFKSIRTEPPGSQSQWNAQTANICRNSALLLMANGRTLADLPTLLSDNDFRDTLLEQLEKVKREKSDYEVLLTTWGQYKRLARTDQWISWVEPILNRVAPALSDPRIQPILARQDGGIKLDQIIEQKQILLVNVSKSSLDGNAKLLAGLIASGIVQAAFSGKAEKSPRSVSLYLDELDDVIDEDILRFTDNDTPECQFNLVISAKTLQHWPEDRRNLLLTTVRTMSCFTLDKKDAELLAPQMFRIDGRKLKPETQSLLPWKSPQYELISTEEFEHVQRLVNQEARQFFCYLTGTMAGVFHLLSNDFRDIDDKEVNWEFIKRLQTAKAAPAGDTPSMT